MTYIQNETVTLVAGPAPRGRVDDATGASFWDSVTCHAVNTSTVSKTVDIAAIPQERVDGETLCPEEMLVERVVLSPGQATELEVPDCLGTCTFRFLGPPEDVSGTLAVRNSVTGDLQVQLPAVAPQSGTRRTTLVRPGRDTLTHFGCVAFGPRDPNGPDRFTADMSLKLYDAGTGDLVVDESYCLGPDCAPGFIDTISPEDAILEMLLPSNVYPDLDLSRDVSFVCEVDAEEPVTLTAWVTDRADPARAIIEQVDFAR